MAFCSRTVFRCFKCIERAADRITGTAGPFFIAIAYVLLGMSTVAFFEVIAPTLPLRIFSIPICLLLAINMFAHYYYACTVPPGFADDTPSSITIREGSSWIWARKRDSQRTLRWSDELHLSAPIFNKCKRCGVQRPERSHHCRICKRCVLKYDHHCPVCRSYCFLKARLTRIGSGLTNVVYLVICTFCFSTLGWPAIWETVELYGDWGHRTPTWMFLLCYILAVVICLSVTVMCSWHLWSVASGETTVENHDFDAYRKLALSRDNNFVNSFDLGPRRNIALFFNIGSTGYPLYSLLLPFRTAPYTDGLSWVKKEGYNRHGGIAEDDEYTDED